jgi:hypothetical protein
MHSLKTLKIKNSAENFNKPVTRGMTAMKNMAAFGTFS